MTLSAAKSMTRSTLCRPVSGSKERSRYKYIRDYVRDATYSPFRSPSRVDYLSLRHYTSRRMRCLYLPIRLLENVCKIGRGEAVVLSHLLYCQKALWWVFRPRTLRCQVRVTNRYRPAMRSCKDLFSSPLTGAWKNVVSTECIQFASLGARVSHEWEKVCEMKGTPP